MKTLFQSSVALVLCVSVGACASPPHVELRAPSASASFEERAQALEQLHATSAHETHITYLRNGVPVGAARTTDYLQLNGGERVYHPEDILPVVKEDSAAAAAAERSAEATSTANTVQGWGWALTGVGPAVMLSSVFFIEDAETSPDFSGMWTVMAIGGVITIGGLITGLIGGSYRRQANDDKATAFELYNKALAQRLDICADGKALVPCAQAGGSSAAPSDVELGD